VIHTNAVPPCLRAAWAAVIGPQWVPDEDSGVLREGSYLVDPASSHMLVSKIKPCMSKYKLLIL
jgi:hypothetical protein